MSLVTRCPSCSTLFRIVPDQIRVAAGWVRCGHCGEVFDASTHMLPRRRGVPQAAASSARAETADASALVTLPPPAASPLPWHADDQQPPPNTHGPAPGSTQPMDSWPSLSLLPADGDEGLGKEPAGIDADPAAPQAPADLQEAIHAGGGNEPVLDDSVDPGLDIESLPSASRPMALADPVLEHHDDPVVAAPAAEPAPSFVVAARRRSFWSSAPMRALAWFALLALGLGLAAQLVFMQRSWLAARLPPWAPGLQAACAALGCRIDPYRRLDAITIEDSSFLRREGEPFQLSVSLRNGADLAVASPAIELTLTDVSDQALARRVFTAAELGMPPALAAHGQAGSTREIHLADPVDPQAVAGYRVKAFYP